MRRRNDLLLMNVADVCNKQHKQNKSPGGRVMSPQRHLNSNQYKAIFQLRRKLKSVCFLKTNMPENPGQVLFPGPQLYASVCLSLLTGFIFQRDACEAGFLAQVRFGRLHHFWLRGSLCNPNLPRSHKDCFKRLL